MSSHKRDELVLEKNSRHRWSGRHLGELFAFYSLMLDKLLIYAYIYHYTFMSSVRVQVEPTRRFGSDFSFLPLMCL